MEQGIYNIAIKGKSMINGGPVVVLLQMVVLLAYFQLFKRKLHKEARDG